MATSPRFADSILYCHRTMLKVMFSRLTLSNNFYINYGGSSSSSSSYLVRDKGYSSLPFFPPQSLSSPLMFVPPKIDVVDKFDESVSTDHNDYFHFFNPAKQTKIRVTKKLSIPWQKEILMPDDAYCVGSSHGWLAFVHPRSCNPYLFNPILQEYSSHLPYVPLPPYETLDDVQCLRVQKKDHLSPSPSLLKDFILIGEKENKYAPYRSLDYNISLDYNRSVDKESKHFIEKVAMSSALSLPRSSSPRKYDSTVMIIHRGALYFCKFGDQKWHRLDGPHDVRRQMPGTSNYHEIMYFSKDQRFYAMSKQEQYIVVFDLRDTSNSIFKSKVINPSSCPWEGVNHCSSYLVESSGDLLLVMRFYEADYGDREEDYHYEPFKEQRVNRECNIRNVYKTLRFDVYKLNFDQKKWEPVECLSDQALFVGRNHSFSLSTLEYSELRENSIYFTDNYHFISEAMNAVQNNGAFHLKDNSITPYYPFTSNSSELPQVRAPYPVWVAPHKL